MDKDERIKELEEENNVLKQLSEKYSNPQKSYYERNKTIINQKAKERLKKIAQENPDKIKEYAKKAYLNKKSKLEQAKIESQHI